MEMLIVRDSIQIVIRT